MELVYERVNDPLGRIEDVLEEERVINELYGRQRITYKVLCK